MKFACFIISCVLLASCSCNSCDSADGCVKICVKQKHQHNNQNYQHNNQNSQNSDWQITTKVKTSIMADGSLSASSRLVSITTNNGVVTISGNVASKADMRRIVRLAKEVNGVRKVDNQMTGS